MVWSKTINLIIGASLLFLLVAALSFVNGPGILRDILPSFYIGEEEQVEWNQNYFIDDAYLVFIEADYDEAGPDVFNDDDDYYYYYFNKDSSHYSGGREGWISAYGEWPQGNFNAVWLDRFSDRSEDNKRLILDLKSSTFESGLRQIIANAVRNDFMIKIYVASNDFIAEPNMRNSPEVTTPALTYLSGDPKLKDIDFIIFTINKATQGYKKSRGIE